MTLGPFPYDIDNRLPPITSTYASTMAPFAPHRQPHRMVDASETLLSIPSHDQTVAGPQRLSSAVPQISHPIASSLPSITLPGIKDIMRVEDDFSSASANQALEDEHQNFGGRELEDGTWVSESGRSSSPPASIRPETLTPLVTGATQASGTPITSNAAMMRFRLRAKEVGAQAGHMETGAAASDADDESVAASVGSRRLSDPDHP